MADSKAPAVRRELRKDPHASDSEIARRAGCNRVTVATFKRKNPNWLAEVTERVEAAGEAAAFKRLERRHAFIEKVYELAESVAAAPTDPALLRAFEKVIRDDDRDLDAALKAEADKADALPLVWAEPTKGRRITAPWVEGHPLQWEEYRTETAAYLAEDIGPAYIAFRPHPGQVEVAHAWQTHAARHIVFQSGRRNGKSELALALIDQHCADPQEWGGLDKPNVLVVCPSNVQARDIYWKSGKVHKRWKGRAQLRESDCEVVLPNDGRVAFRGVENAGAREGQGYTMIVIDEAGLIDDLETVMNRTLLPMLMDARGRLLVIGTPKQVGGYYDALFDKGQAGPKRDPDWLSFRGASINNWYLHADEIEAMRRALDARSFRAEILGIPTAHQGQIFAFDRDRHVGKVKYRADLPLAISWDFNFIPMSVLIGQYQPMRDDATGRRWEHFVVLGEMSMPETRTEAAARAVCQHERWGQHRGGIKIYGDATGGARDSTSGTSDWAIIEKVFRAHFGREHVEHCYLASNPAVIDSDNAVNACLAPGDGLPLITIADGCSVLINDLTTLTIPEDGSRRHGKARAERKGVGHMADSLRYWIARERPIDTIIWATR